MRINPCLKLMFKKQIFDLFLFKYNLVSAQLFWKLLTLYLCNILLLYNIIRKQNNYKLITVNIDKLIIGSQWHVALF